MRRYLDVELAAGSLSEEKLVQIHKRVLKKYGIDLGAIVDGKFQYEELRRVLAQKYHLNSEWDDFRRLLFLENDLQKFDESISRLQSERGKIVRANNAIGNKEGTGEKIKKLQEEDLMKLYEEIIREEEQMSPVKDVSCDDCIKMMEYIMSKSRVLDNDCALKFLMRQKYTQKAEEKYNYYSGRKSEKIDCRSRLKSMKLFPMKDSNNLPVFIKELQDILFTQKYVRLFDFNVFGNEKEIKKGSLDITRYSYKYIEDIYSKLEGASYENTYYLNDVLGISLTNTIFLCIYNVVKNSENESGALNYKFINEKMFDVATMLGKFKCIYSRDILAKIVFVFLLSFKEENCLEGEPDSDCICKNIGKACDQICDYLTTSIVRINDYYSNLCDASAWLYENDNQLKLDFDNGAVSELERELEIWMKGYIQSKAIDKVFGDYTRKSGNEYKIRKMKLIKEPDNLYAQIHMAVMRGIWE